MKRIIAMVIVLVMMISMLPNSTAFAESEEVKINFTLSNQGVIGVASDESLMLNKEVVVTDLDEDGNYTVHEALVAAHEMYNMAEGYNASYGYVNKLWGIETSNTLFFVNNVGITSGVAVDTVQNGDKLLASVNADNVYYSDWYTFFDTDFKTAFVGEEISLTLKGYYGMAYNEEEKISVTLENITVKADDESFVTDEEGKVTLSFDEPGIYYLTASGTVSDVVTDWSLSETRSYPDIYAKLDYSTFEYTIAYTDTDYGDGPYPADEVLYVDMDTWSENPESYNALHSNQLVFDCPIITSGCIVEVKEPSVEIIHNIAQKVVEGDIFNDANMHWFVADMAMYGELYPESEFVLTDDVKQECIDKLISESKETTHPSVLAKVILALRSLGYDAKNVVTVDYQKLDIVEKLTDMFEEQNSAVTNPYTVPYVIMALSQDGYATEEQMNYLVNAALASKDIWTMYGSDGAAPMFLALASHYNTDGDVKAVIDEKLEEIKALQQETGSMENSCATGLAVAGLSALGIDAQSIVKGEKNLIDGLMIHATEELNGFEPTDTSFATEQCFRGLLAWQMYKRHGRAIYDFSQYPLNQAKATWAENCPVIFNVVPEDAVVTIEGATAVSGNRFDLAEGTYDYTVSKSGYLTKNGVLELTAEDVQQHKGKLIEVSLRSHGVSGDAIDNKINIKVKVMVHDENKCNNGYTYKNNSASYTELLTETISIDKGQTVFDVLDAALEKNNIDYIEVSYGYISEINGVAEFDHGEKSGWMFNVNGKYVDSSCRDTKLNSDSTVVWFYTDDYSSEKGSESFVPVVGTIMSGGNTGGSTGVKAPLPRVEMQPEATNEFFEDVTETEWYYPAVKYVYENKLMSGTENGFEPDANMTRAMLVTVLYRYAAPEAEKIVNSFEDVPEGKWYSDGVAWAFKNNIVSGVSEKFFAPDEPVSREQMVTILYRYAKADDTAIKNDLMKFSDSNKISDWAVDAFAWAIDKGIITGTSETELSPDSTATRAQVATILMRFMGMTEGI